MAKAASDCTKEQSRKIPLLSGPGDPQVVDMQELFLQIISLQQVLL